MDTIRHNLIILLFLCPALALRDKITPNTDTIIPGQFYEPVYDSSFLKKLNKIKTLELINGIGSIELDMTDVASLSTDCYNEEACLDFKSKALIKYRMKMEALQCVGGAIVQHILPDLSGIVLRKKRYGFGGHNIFHYPRKLVARILSILKFGKIRAHKWLWIAYIRILAADNWLRYYHVIEDEHFDDPKLNDELLEYLSLCQKHKYLPHTSNQLSTSYAEKCIGFEMDCLTDQFYSKDINEDGSYLEEIKSYLYTFQEYYLTLTHIKGHREDSIFGKSHGLHFVWNETREKLIRAKTQLNFRKHTYEWVLNPFVYLEYHQLIMKIVEFKLHIYVWLHLKTLSENIAFIKQHELLAVFLPNIDYFYTTFYASLKDAVRYVGAEDWFLWGLVERLHPDSTSADQYGKDGFLQSDLSTIESKMFNYTKDLDVDETSFRNALKKVPRNNIFYKTIKANMPFLLDRRIKKIERYLKGIETTLLPVDYGLIPFFCNGNARIEQTFYLPVQQDM